MSLYGTKVSLAHACCEQLKHVNFNVNIRHALRHERITRRRQSLSSAGVVLCWGLSHNDACVAEACSCYAERGETEDMEGQGNIIGKRKVRFMSINEMRISAMWYAGPPLMPLPLATGVR